MIQETTMVVSICGTLLGLIKSILTFSKDDANHYHRWHLLFILSSTILSISGTKRIFKLCGVPGIMEGIVSIATEIKYSARVTEFFKL